MPSSSSIIPLHYYIAFNRPKEAVQVMESFGYTVQVRDKTGVANTIAQFLTREGEKGLQAIAKIHPDRDLILETQPKNLSADGFQETSSTASIIPPAPAPATATKQQTDYTPIIIGSLIASALFLSVAVISKNK